MLARLDIVKQRFDEVSDLIIQPNIIADQKRYVQLTKEYKDLKELMDKRQEYIILTGNIAEAEEIIKDGSDPEMVEMARLQFDEAKEKLPQLEEEIKTLKIVKMPLWKFVRVQVEMKLQYSLVIFIECITNIVKIKVGVFL